MRGIWWFTVVVALCSLKVHPAPEAARAAVADGVGTTVLGTHYIAKMGTVWPDGAPATLLLQACGFDFRFIEGKHGGGPGGGPDVPGWTKSRDILGTGLPVACWTLDT